jgi:predicted MFS family arabinose efflux permease
MARPPSDGRAPLVPLALATSASQALLVVLAPTTVAIGADLGASVGAVGQARSVTALVAVAASAAIVRRVEAIGVRRLVAIGGVLAAVACAAVAAAPTLAAFLLAHVLVGAALACLLSAGFAGAAAFPPERRAWALGWVAGSNALAWIAVAPLVGVVAARTSWRVAEAVPAALALAAVAASPAVRPGREAPSVPHLRALLAHGPARRWIGAELAAYAAWASLLTFVGAFFVDGLGVPEGRAGLLLACGAAAFFASATRGAGLVAGAPRRPLVAVVSLLMAALIVVQFGLAGTAAFATVAFCLVGLAAGIRTPASSALGLEQLPGHPGAMMAARTAATQLGYLLGAVVGGTVITVAGYGALGVVLAAFMAVSALLMLRLDGRREPVPA